MQRGEAKIEDKVVGYKARYLSKVMFPIVSEDFLI